MALLCYLTSTLIHASSIYLVIDCSPTLLVKQCKITHLVFLNKKTKERQKRTAVWRHHFLLESELPVWSFQPWKQCAAVGCRACWAAAGPAGLEAAVVCADAKRAPRTGSSAVSDRVISETMAVPWCQGKQDELPGSQAVEVGDLGGRFVLFFFSTRGSIFDQEVALQALQVGLPILPCFLFCFSTLSPLCLCRWQAEGRPNQSPTVSFPTRRRSGSAFNRKSCSFKWMWGKTEGAKNEGRKETEPQQRRCSESIFSLLKLLWSIRIGVTIQSNKRFDL